MIHKQIGKGSDKVIPEFVEGEEASGKASELHKEFYAELQDRSHALPGAKELISSLSEQGYEVWLATSAEQEALEQNMKKLEAEDRVAGVVSSEDAEESKPSPDIFELALERAGCSAEEGVVVGDSVWDVEAAKAAGGESGGGHDRRGVQPRRAGRSGGLRGLRRLCRTTRGRFP